MESIPWSCRVCDRNFETRDGGLCRRCKMPACRGCLYLLEEKTLPDDDTDPQWVCNLCLTVEERNQRPWWRRIVGRFRRANSREL
jgi:hypothetical protein